LKKKNPVEFRVDFFFPLARQICPTRQKNVKRKKGKILDSPSAAHCINWNKETSVKQVRNQSHGRRPDRSIFGVCVSFPVEGFLLPTKIPQF
jgi:hypothetical protein